MPPALCGAAQTAKSPRRAVRLIPRAVHSRDLKELSGTVLLFGGAVGNVQALQALRRRAEDLAIPASSVICLGDIAAYCADAEASVNTVRDWGVVVVAGNCEHSFADESDDCGCGFSEDSLCDVLAREWHSRASAQLGAANKKWMSTLPAQAHFIWHGLTFSVVHGAPSAVNKFIFPSTLSTDIAAEIQITGADVVVAGHSGIPFGQQTTAGWWLNPGSIGLPANDGTPDGWYILLQKEADESLCCHFYRLTYDWRQAQKAMRVLGISGGYADTLASGLWPSMDILPAAERVRQGQRLAPASLTLDCGVFNNL